MNWSRKLVQHPIYFKRNWLYDLVWSGSQFGLAQMVYLHTSKFWVCIVSLSLFLHTLSFFFFFGQKLSVHIFSRRCFMCSLGRFAPLLTNIGPWEKCPFRPLRYWSELGCRRGPRARTTQLINQQKVHAFEGKNRNRVHAGVLIRIGLSVHVVLRPSGSWPVLLAVMKFSDDQKYEMKGDQGRMELGLNSNRSHNLQT